MISKSAQRGSAVGKCVRRRAGVHLVRVKPCFSADSRYLFVAADTCLLVYSTKTGELVHRLNDDDRGQIVSMFTNNANSMQLITVTSDGVISYWDYEDGILIRDVSIPIAEIKFAYPGTSANCFFLAVWVVKTSAYEEDRVSLVYAHASAIAGGVMKRKVLVDKVVADERMTAVHKSFAASVHDNVLFVRNAETHYYKKQLISDQMAFTCVVWHPQGNCLATGDSIGRIILWYDITPNGDFDSKPVKNQVHWHTNPVADISFSSAGNYLYSGGSECVLLKWNVNAGGKPYFLPRMGLPIRFVVTSTDNSFVATAHTDNSLNVVDSNFKVLHIIQGLAFSGHWEEASLAPLPVGILCDPRTKALVLNGKSGHLQFYNLRENKQLFYLDVTQLNYLTKERNRILYNVEVIKAAFDQQGNWLATVEYRNDMEASPEIRLKFWKYDHGAQMFSLRTSIEMPHWDKINCILFQPNCSSNAKALLATTSDDKRLKFWSFTKDPDDPRQPKYWTCRGAGFYRDLPAGDASFAEDGSVLAVAFDRIVALWLPADNVLKATLCCPRFQEKVGQVAFGRYDCSHLVACSSIGSLTVWDTLSLSVLWSVNVGVSYLTADFATNTMAVFGTHGDLFLFNPSSPEPIEIHKIDENAKIISAAFLPICDDVTETPSSTAAVSHLYFLDDAQMLYSLCEDLAEPSPTRQTTVRSNLPLTPFGLLIAERRKSGVQLVEAKFHELFGSSRKKIVREILRTPCHVMPPATEICSVFLASILKPLQISSKSDEGAEDESDGDSDLDARDDDGADSDAASAIDDDGRLTDKHVVIEAVEQRTTAIQPVLVAVDATISDEELKRIENNDYGWIDPWVDVH